MVKGVTLRGLIFNYRFGCNGGINPTMNVIKQLLHKSVPKKLNDICSCKKIGRNQVIDEIHSMINKL